jgi:hypothetical protein
VIHGYTCSNTHAAPVPCRRVCTARMGARRQQRRERYQRSKEQQPAASSSPPGSPPPQQQQQPTAATRAPAAALGAAGAAQHVTWGAYGPSQPTATTSAAPATGPYDAPRSASAAARASFGRAAAPHQGPQTSAGPSVRGPAPPLPLPALSSSMPMALVSALRAAPDSQRAQVDRRAPRRDREPAMWLCPAAPLQLLCSCVLLGFEVRPNPNAGALGLCRCAQGGGAGPRGSSSRARRSPSRSRRAGRASSRSWWRLGRDTRRSASWAHACGGSSLSSAGRSRHSSTRSSGSSSNTAGSGARRRARHSRGGAILCVGCSCVTVTCGSGSGSSCNVGSGGSTSSCCCCIGRRGCGCSGRCLGGTGRRTSNASIHRRAGLGRWGRRAGWRGGGPSRSLRRGGGPGGPGGGAGQRRSSAAIWAARCKAAGAPQSGAARAW